MIKDKEKANCQGNQSIIKKSYSPREEREKTEVWNGGGTLNSFPAGKEAHNGRNKAYAPVSIVVVEVALHSFATS